MGGLAAKVDRTPTRGHLWLSYFATAKLGWTLRRSHAEIGMIFDGRNQYRALRQAKDDFFRELARDPGWLADPVASAPVIPAQHSLGTPPGRY